MTADDRTLEAAVEIAAEPERVWAALVHDRGFADWTPVVRRVEGRLRPGARVTAVFARRGRRVEAPARVSHCEPGAALRLRYVERRPLQAVTEHWMRLTGSGRGATILRLGLRLSPLAALLLGRRARNARLRDLIEMNLALKDHLEAAPVRPRMAAE